MTFATLGDSLSIFTAENGKFNISDSLNCTNDDNLRDLGGGISWSGDGQWITGPIENGGAIPLYKYDESKKLVRMRCVRDADASSKVFLNCTNRLLAIGSKSGAVRLWNVKDKKWHQTLCQSETEPVKFMSVSADDMYVATAGIYSHVKMYGLTTNKLVNTLSIGSKNEVSALQFSSIKKNWLGGSSLEGSVIVWDVYKSAEIMNKKKTHVSACTGIAMSPVNHYVLASIALNGHFALHDVREKTPVLSIDVEAVGSCVELMKNEPYALIGSRDGRLLMIDLRSSDTVCNEKVHQKPVKCVRAVLIAKTNAYEDVPVGTPENECTKQLWDMTLADVFTPPSGQTLPSNQSMNMVDISPITPAPGHNRATIDQTTSTPNQLVCDSFLNLFDASSQPANHTLLPFRQTPSPLAKSVAPRVPRPEGLNRIHEVSEHDENHHSAITSQDLVNLKEEILSCVRSENERAMEQILTCVRSENERVMEQIGKIQKQLKNAIEENTFGIYQNNREIRELRHVIRYEQVIEELTEQGII